MQSAIGPRTTVGELLARYSAVVLKRPPAKARAVKPTPPVR
jgi:hypothetical protein